MRLLNPTHIRDRATPYLSRIPPKVESRPRVFRLAGRRLAYYPEDMALYEAGEEDVPPARSVPYAPPKNHPAAAIQHIVVFPTHECNLACKYCYLLQRGTHRPSDASTAPADLMSERTACRAIDLLLRARRVAVSFFGGEPLLAWGRVRWIAERAEALAATKGRERPKLHVTTNGTLLTPDRAEFLARHGFSLIVSLDGPPPIHDEARCGSYADVLRGLTYIARHPKLAERTTLRGTFRPGERQLARRLEHLNSLCDRGLAGNVSVEPASGCGYCGGPAGGYERGEIARLMLSAVPWAVDRARSGMRVRWFHLQKPLRRIMRRELAWSECGAAKGYCAVSPDGTLHACHHEGHEIGRLPGGIQPDRVGPWRDNLLTARPRCARCWARHVCGGGCRMEGHYEREVIGPGPVGCAGAKARALTALRVVAELADEPDVLRRVVGGT